MPAAMASRRVAASGPPVGVGALEHPASVLELLASDPEWIGRNAMKLAKKCED